MSGFQKNLGFGVVLGDLGPQKAFAQTGQNNRKSLGHWPVEPCLSHRVSQGHPAGVPGISLKFMCPFLF